MRCRRSTSTASASRKMFDSAWPAICARFGYSLLPRALARRLVHAAGADDEDALGAQVHRRRDRRRLAHRAVAEVLGVAVESPAATAGNTNGIADDASRCGMPMSAAHGDALRARPRHDVVDRVVEGHVHAASRSSTR